MGVSKVVPRAYHNVSGDGRCSSLHQPLVKKVTVAPKPRPAGWGSSAGLVIAIACLVSVGAIVQLLGNVGRAGAVVAPTPSPSNFVNRRVKEKFVPLTCNFKNLPSTLDNAMNGRLRRGPVKRTTLLKNHVPHTASILKDELDYFQICISCHSNNTSDLKFDVKLESIKGNTDLYVSVDTMWPSFKKAEFIVDRGQGAELSFDTTNPILQNVLESISTPGKVTRSTSGMIVPPYVYFSVMGSEDSEYALTVDVSRLSV